MSSVSVCALVSFVDAYRCPIDYNIDEEEFQKLAFPQPREIKPRNIPGGLHGACVGGGNVDYLLRMVEAR